MKKWWILGADFFTVWCRFFHGLRRLFTVCKGQKRWKKNISLSMSFFTVSFSRFAPSRNFVLLKANVRGVDNFSSFYTVSDFLFQLSRETPEPPRDRNSDCLSFLRKFEIQATWYRTPTWEFQKSAGGGVGTSAGKNGGAGRSAGTGAGRSGSLGKQRQNSLPAPVPALRPAPPFLPALVPAPPPALFWNSHVGVLYQVAWISSVSCWGLFWRHLRSRDTSGTLQQWA